MDEPKNQIGDEGGGSDAVPAPAQVSARVEALVERGLEKYGEGDLVGALSEWEHALSLDEGSVRADEYIQYVRDNFELLDEQFKMAKEMARQAAAGGVPIPQVPEEVSGAYDLVELGFSRDSATPVGPVAQPVRSAAPARILPPPPVGLDEGWELDDLAAPLPPPPATAAPAPSANGGLDSLDDDLAEVSAGLDQAFSEPPPEPESDAESDRDRPADIEMEAEAADEEELTAAARAKGEARTIEIGDEEEYLEVTVPGGEEPPPLPDRPALSQEAIASLSGRMPVVTIAPREGTNPGTFPGSGPGELPAPPRVATPSELDLELGALDGAVGDDRALGEGRSAGQAASAEDDEAAGEPSMEIGEPVGDAELGMGDDETGEATSPAGRRRAMDLLGDDDFAKTGERAVFAEEMPTIERSSAPAKSPAASLRRVDDDDMEMEFLAGDEADFADGPGTGERTSSRSPFSGDSVTGATSGGAVITGASGSGETLHGIGPSVLVDEDLLKGGAPTAAADSAAARSPDAAASAAQTIPRPSSDEEQIRKRVNDLLRLARESAERGDHRAAVEAAEMVGAEDPDGLVAPVVLHRHRDLLYRIYEGHIGEMTQVPLVAVPLHTISAEALDHKTGFLLSRIDGMLSFEDILDVAGMPRLDAYRILSVLLRKGIIEVR